MTRHARTTAALLTAVLLGGVAGCGPRTEQPPGPGSGKRADPAADTRPAVDDRGFTLVATGDVLAHDSIIQQAKSDARGSGYDFGRMLAGGQRVAGGADVAICHMETVYGAEGGPFSGYPAFRTPPQMADALRHTGYDSCSTASNHTLDAGPEGVRRTLTAMDEAGLRHVGSARSAAERDRPAVLKAGGATVAQLSYTYGTNGIPVPGGSPWLVNLIDPRRIVADARAARRAGADVVAVSLHWGTEWQQRPDGAQLRLARQLTRSQTGGRRDIDLIIGTHNHVPQPYEKVNGTWVVYGLGDQVAGVMNDPRGSMGTAARFTFAPPRERGGAWRVRKAEYVPFLMDSVPRFRLVDLTSRAGRAPGRPDYAEARRTISAAVLSRGAASDGLTLGR